MILFYKFIGMLLLLTVVVSAQAGEADVVAAEVSKQSDGLYSFDVTVRHNDEGWDHYADKWDILAPDGTTLGTRTLFHPHVDEQPFTRSLSSVKIAPGTQTVTIRAHDSVHKYGGKTMDVHLPE